MRTMQVVQEFKHPQGGICICVRFPDSDLKAGNFPARLERVDDGKPTQFGFQDIAADDIVLYSTRVPREAI